MDIKIRDEEPKDFEQVRAILSAAFPTEAESQLVDALREHGKAVISRIAAIDEEVVGYILFSPVSTTPSSEAKGLGLAPVVVRPDLRSQGIGSELIRDGLHLAQKLGFDYCVVLGGPGYYERIGFERASQFGIRNEYGVDHEFMLIHLSDRGVTGLVKYALEFGLFSV